MSGRLTWFAGHFLIIMEENTQLYKFVRSLFVGQGRELSDGFISIEMDGDPRFLVVRLYDDRDNKTVEVNINGNIMGTFHEYSGQGYQYEFRQRYRTGIRNGRTSAEQYLEDTCKWHNDKLHLLKAYH